MTTTQNTRQHPWLIGLLMGLVTLTPMGIDIYLPSLPGMVTHFGVSTSAMQTSITLFIFVVGPGQLLIGPLADRYGRRPVALGGALAYLLGSALAAGVNTLELFYFARIIQGLGACAASLVAFAAVRDCYTPTMGARIYSYLNGALCVVPALAPLLGSVLDAHTGWRGTFLFMALFSATLGGFIASRFVETLPVLAPSAQRPVQSWRTYLPIIMNGRFLYFAVFGMMGLTMILLFVPSAPVVLVQQLGISPLGFAAWFGGNAAVNIVSFFSAPIFIARYGRYQMLRVGLLSLLVAAIMHGVAWLFLPLSALVFMLPVAVLTVGFSLALGSALSLALEPYPDRAGKAAAVFGLLQMSGAAVIATLLLEIGIPAQAAMALIGIGFGVVLLFLFPRIAR